jgi:hypothetical protein
LNTLLAAAVNESVQLLLKGKDMVTSAKSDNTTVAVKDAPEHSVLIHSRKLAQLLSQPNQPPPPQPQLL